MIPEHIRDYLIDACDMLDSFRDRATENELQHIEADVEEIRAWLEAQEQPQPNADGLLPCPFCGGNAEWEGEVKEACWIGCVNPECDLSPQNFFDVAELDNVKAAWNRRAQPAQPQPQPDVVEALAAYAHEAWSEWMWYLFDDARGQWRGANWLIYSGPLERWQRQMQTEYDDLPESEKGSDRKEARKILDIICAAGYVYGADSDRSARAPTPDWTIAENWAMWWAVDADGMACWYEREPHIYVNVWSGNADEKAAHYGEIELPIGIDWRTTLQARPEADHA